MRGLNFCVARQETGTVKPGVLHNCLNLKRRIDNESFFRIEHNQDSSMLEQAVQFNIAVFGVYFQYVRTSGSIRYCSFWCQPK